MFVFMVLVYVQKAIVGTGGFRSKHSKHKQAKQDWAYKGLRMPMYSYVKEAMPGLCI